MPDVDVAYQARVPSPSGRICIGLCVGGGRPPRWRAGDGRCRRTADRTNPVGSCHLRFYLLRLRLLLFDVGFFCGLGGELLRDIGARHTEDSAPPPSTSPPAPRVIGPQEDRTARALNDGRAGGGPQDRVLRWQKRVSGCEAGVAVDARPHPAPRVRAPSGEGAHVHARGASTTRCGGASSPLLDGAIVRVAPRLA